ncbi:hypothetical protein E2C01_082185 [Portunus trituberculatus]|uniref:Uncharacterized protein n=1 Tax=Portunus trituberculatus TaxID=210409 RepID=A0A5B7J050_PORTR|nr:hypothetical protein [Portunus trituberculatus]
MPSWTRTRPPRRTPTLKRASPRGRHCCSSAGRAWSSSTRRRRAGAPPPGVRSVTSMVTKKRFGSR